MKQRWDIFCAVIDNLGDVGICWRLSRQLAQEQGFSVRLWVDSMPAFARIVPGIDVSAARQQVRGVTVCHWQHPFAWTDPADVVIEAFACRLPDDYVRTMAAVSGQRRSLWLNLEYLSAESWVTGCHTLPSPHPRLPLVTYFFFPGFVSGTGGLLREQQLLSDRQAFDVTAQVAFWQKLGVPLRKNREWRISLFCYDHHGGSLQQLLAAWSVSPVPVYVLVAEEMVPAAVLHFFNTGTLRAGSNVQAGSLTVQVIPFLEQADYDRLLWACDINFVRGEDSFVRAQWAQQPFIWQIYPQADNAHQVKLDAFLDLYTRQLPFEAAGAVRALWHGWNDCSDSPIPMSQAWAGFVAACPVLERYGEEWAGQLQQTNDLVSNLVQFTRNRIESASF